MAIVGDVIDVAFLKSLPEYNKVDPITDLMVAAEASKRYSNYLSKAEEAVESMFDRWKQVGTVNTATLLYFYNATGGPMSYLTHYDWHGHIDSMGYPQLIQNGQFGCFLHVKTTGAAFGSEAAAIFSVSKGVDDVLLAWNSPGGASSNTVFCGIGPSGNWPTHISWDTVQDKLENAKEGIVLNYPNYKIEGFIGQTRAEVCKFIITKTS